MRRWKEDLPILYSTPSVKILFLALGFAIIGTIVLLGQISVNSIRDLFGIGGSVSFMIVANQFFIVATVLSVAAGIERYTRSDTRHIRYLVRVKLCNPKYGNPLGLKNGCIGPTIGVWEARRGYRIRIGCASVSFEKVSDLESTISSSLDGDFSGYAVTAVEPSESKLYVDYYVDNEVLNATKQDVYDSIEDMRRRYE